MKSSRLFSFFLVLTLAFSFASCTEKARDAKYVFYFIGDGMGFSHVALSEAYLAAKEGKIVQSEKKRAIALPIDKKSLYLHPRNCV